MCFYSGLCESEQVTVLEGSSLSFQVFKNILQDMIFRLSTKSIQTAFLLCSDISAEVKFLFGSLSNSIKTNLHSGIMDAEYYVQ